MAWLRVDDGFAQHPKVLKLAPKDRWTWLEILCYCARYRTNGSVSEAISSAIRAATPAYLNRCYEIGLLDLDENGYEVHDWAVYNPKDPTAALRMERHRNRNADRNETVTGTVTSTVTEPSPRARARARVPSPSPTPTPNQGSTVSTTDRPSGTTPPDAGFENGTPEDQPDPADLARIAALAKQTEDALQETPWK